MINYGDAIQWCVKNNAVMRFVDRDSRREFVDFDGLTGLALEMCVEISGKKIAGHMVLDTTKAPSNAVAEAVIGCVEFFLQKQKGAVIGLN